MPAAGNHDRAVPVFTVVRSAEEEPDCVPATSPRLRRRLSAWPSGPANEDLSGSSRRIGKQRDAPRPAQIRQVRAGVKIEGRNNAGSSRTPFRHARRTRPIWQCWTRPGFVRAAPALPGTTRIRLPSATLTCCDRPAAKVSHLHSNQQRLTAQTVNLTDPVTLPGYDSSSPEGLLCSGLAGECAFNQGAAKAHGEVRAQRCGQQTESVLSQVADSRQIDSAEGREPAAEQIVKRRVKNCEDRDAQQWLPVK
jgi:hypothetical protein